MDKQNKLLRRYYRRICSWLPCSRKIKKSIIQRIDNTIQDRLALNPSCKLSEIEHWFGTPQQIAATYIDEMDMQDLLRSLKIRKKVLRIILIAVTIMVSVYIAAITAAFINELDNASAQIIEGELIIQDNQLNQGE